jgi:hypothetical protein
MRTLFDKRIINFLRQTVLPLSMDGTWLPGWKNGTWKKVKKEKLIYQRLKNRMLFTN